MCADKAMLTAFWDAMMAEMDIGRRHGIERAYEAVRAVRAEDAMKAAGP